jgi:hypothetical protein
VITSRACRAALLGWLALIACRRPLGHEAAPLDGSAPATPDAGEPGRSADASPSDLPIEAPASDCRMSTSDTLLADPTGGPCRFRTLGEALAMTGARWKRVIASGTFESETFPLVVPAGVTLTGHPEALDPGGARIVFTGKAEELITLRAGATLAGLTVENRGGDDGAAAVSCTSGPVTIRSVELIGTGGGSALRTGMQLGRAYEDDCSATVERLKVRGFGSGLEGIAAGPSTITDTTFEDNLTALTVTAARLVMSRVTIRGRPGAAALGFSIYADTDKRGAVVEASDLIIEDTAIAIDLSAGAPYVAPRLSIDGAQILRSGDGIRVAGGSLEITVSQILASRGHGVTIAGGQVALGDVEIAAGGATGLVIEKGEQLETQLTLVNNRIHGNQLGPGETVGGIFFAAPATLVRFTGNDLHGNAGHQLGFGARPSVGERWSLGVSSCDSFTVNRIRCYAPGQVGIAVSSPLPTVVDVQGTAWQNAAPAPLVDWLGSGSAGNSVRLADAPCPSGGTCP